MPLSPKELTKLVKFCRKQGISRLKTADIEIDLAPEAPKRPRKTAVENELDKFPSWDSLTREQQLLYSSTPLDTGIQNA